MLNILEDATNKNLQSPDGKAQHEKYTRRWGKQAQIKTPKARSMQINRHVEHKSTNMCGKATSTNWPK